MNNNTLAYLELFSGIGGFRQAIELYARDSGINTKCVGFSEIDKYATATYKANFDTSDEIEIGDIKKFTEDIENIQSLPNFDLLLGGFPCQAFSMMGEQKGFADNQGNLFYNIIEILRIKKPKYVLLENVRNIKTHNKGQTYREIIRCLQEDVDYKVYTDILNTADFGLPQTRRRMFFFAIRKDLMTDANDIMFDTVSIRKELTLENTSLKTYTTVLDGLLEKKVEEKYYLSEKIKPTILANGSKNFQSKSEINQLIARPLTATMVKMHRACQDNYYSDNFLNSSDPLAYLEKNFTKEEQATHKIRKLTPLEALKLQGFDDNFWLNATDAKISNHQLYKQAGNAVSVNVIYAIINYLIKMKWIKI